MELVKIIDGNPVPYTEAAFRADNKHTAYGPVVSSRHLNPQGVYRVRYEPKPEQIGMKAVEAAGSLQGNEWVVGWNLVPLDEAEARNLRDKLLAATDWTANSDVVMSDAMRAYRQALRDLPQQAGFPNDVTWPTKPE